MHRRPEVFTKWVRATTLGWLVGLVLVIALALVWDTIASTAQFMVGLGMGAGVGFFQSRLLREWLPAPRRWLWATIIGMGLPFVLWDISAALGANSFFSQTTCVLVGSLLVGAAQTLLLPSRSRRVFWWIPACVLGWGLPVGLMELGHSEFLPGPWGAVSVLTIFFGGFILGVVTAPALPWVLEAEASASN